MRHMDGLNMEEGVDKVLEKLKVRHCYFRVNQYSFCVIGASNGRVAFIREVTSGGHPDVHQFTFLCGSAEDVT